MGILDTFGYKQIYPKPGDARIKVYLKGTTAYFKVPLYRKDDNGCDLFTLTRKDNYQEWYDPNDSVEPEVTIVDEGTDADIVQKMIQIGKEDSLC